MTKKHYRELARVFAETFPTDHEAYAVWHEIRGKLMEVLQQDNPNFNRHLFIEATEADPE